MEQTAQSARSDQPLRQETPTGAPPPLSDAIARLMAQPELLSMVASALGAPLPSEAAKPTEQSVAQASEATGSTETSAPAADTPAPSISAASVGASLPELISTIAPLLGGKAEGIPSGKDDNRTCLLRALKPYLSPGRREAIDYMIRLSRLSQTIKHLT